MASRSEIYSIGAFELCSCFCAVAMMMAVREADSNDDER